MISGVMADFRLQGRAACCGIVISIDCTHAHSSVTGSMGTGSYGCTMARNCLPDSSEKADGKGEQFLLPVSDWSSEIAFRSACTLEKPEWFLTAGEMFVPIHFLRFLGKIAAERPAATVLTFLLQTNPSLHSLKLDMLFRPNSLMASCLLTGR